MKDRVAPNVFSPNYVADAESLMEIIGKRSTENAKAINNAYKDLEKAAGGKFPVDGKAFASKAKARLEAEDRLDYLPSTIRKKLDDYAAGDKQMNFNLFENLRTDLAAEIRKAQRTGDGNAAYVLGQVRNELEKIGRAHV